VSEETQKSKQPTGPVILLFINDEGEVMVGTQNGQFHPQEMIHMCEIAKAKLELLLFHSMMQAQQEQQARSKHPSLYVPEPPRVR
jgi:hypothetical protein